MCEGNFFKRTAAQVGGFFSTPTLAKGTPSITVAAMDFLGLNLSDLLTLVTIVYTLCLLLGALPKAVQGVAFVMHWLKTRKAGDDD